MGFKKLRDSIRKKIRNVIGRFFKKDKDLKLGIYGPPNAGKTTLANRICMDFVGEEMGAVSPIAHETRKVMIKENVTIKSKNGRELTINLVDTPGIATKIDFEDFVKKGLKIADAKQRAKEATQGVIEAISWLDKMDMVMAIMDSTKNPYTQVNITILGNLEARNIPILLVANKCDVKNAEPERIKKLFPQYELIPISAKTGKNIEDLYEKIFQMVDKR